MLYISGRSDDAAEVYRQWHSQDPANPVAQHLLAACSRENAPRRASDTYVATTLDTFAASFDDVMARLNYHAPALVHDAVKQAIGESAGTQAVLDAGCGTGLCGPLVSIGRDFLRSGGDGVIVADQGVTN